MNGLAALPDALFHMPSLELLNVSFNPLQSLPAGVGRLAKLRNLHLAGTGRERCFHCLALERNDVPRSGPGNQCTQLTGAPSSPQKIPS